MARSTAASPRASGRGFTKRCALAPTGSLRVPISATTLFRARLRFPAFAACTWRHLRLIPRWDKRVSAKAAPSRRRPPSPMPSTMPSKASARRFWYRRSRRTGSLPPSGRQLSLRACHKPSSDSHCFGFCADRGFHMSDTGNYDKQTLRGFLQMVEAEFPEELLRISAPVDTRYDMTAIVFELERAGKSPVITFENPAANRMPVITNVAANRKLLAACLGVDSTELPAAFRERCQRYLPCEVVEDAAWQDVVIEGDALDLSALPIPLQFSVDGGPYITAGQISARDPVTGVDTTGFHRLMLKGKNRLGLSLHSRRRMYEFQRRAEEKGQSLPAAIAIGTHPLHYMGSMVYAYPPQVRKFETIAGLFREPYRVARCGPGDIEVPAGAENVIVGEILADTREPEGPFGEFTGYASYRSTQHVFVAHRLRMRRDAMFQSVTSGMSKDHILVSCITPEGALLNSLRRHLPNVRAVHVPP